MDQCCAPNRPNALSTHSQRIISDHPPKRHFDWESGNVIDTTCKFDILRSQMLLSSKEAVLRPDPNSTHSWTLMTKTLDLIYYLRKKSCDHASKRQRLGSFARGALLRRASKTAICTSSEANVCCNSCGFCWAPGTRLAPPGWAFPSSWLDKKITAGLGSPQLAEWANTPSLQQLAALKRTTLKSTSTTQHGVSQ